MAKGIRWLLIAVLVGAASFGSMARADVNNASATNVQEGDNEAETDQSGSSNSGDAVGGQVVGVVSGGDASVDATNRSEDVEIETGEAEGTNSASQFVGLTAGTSTNVAADVLNNQATNVQEGDNEGEIVQAAEASSGDGVGGSVIGVVTTAGGSADIVAANSSEDVEIETGDSAADNDAAAFVGLNASGTVLTASDVFNASATHVQEGDNEFSADQSAESASGDGVAGQVLGIVSSGDASIDATSSTEDAEVETGESSADNSASAFVGLTASTDTTVAADILNNAAANVQEGDNDKSIVQAADAASGDAVAGQVAGVVTSAGGSADLVLANSTEDAEAESGESTFSNIDTSFTGLNASGLISVF